eukprot:scaffold15105_cov36-Cyclotella_meneghiniana.AAC.4
MKRSKPNGKDNPKKRHFKKRHSLSAPSNLEPGNSIQYHRDNTIWHLRILLFLCEVVATRDAVLSPLFNNKLKEFYFDDGTQRVGLYFGCGDILSMSQQVNGDIPLEDLDGNFKTVKHGAGGVNKTASVVHHYRWLDREGYRSYLAGIEGRQATSANDIPALSDIDLSTTQLEMFELNKWRIIPPVTPQKVKFVKLLILRGMFIGRQGYDPVELQSGVDHAFSNGLFTDILNSNPKRIPLLTTGGPYNSVRVVKKLRESTFFDQYFQDSLRKHPGGICGEVYVRLYDNIYKTVSSLPKKRLALPGSLKLSFAHAKLLRISEKITLIEQESNDENSKQERLFFYKKLQESIRMKMLSM